MKRVLASLLALALVIAPLRAQDIYNPPVAGQLPGTATNDNASAGNVGEYISSTVLVGSAVSLTTGTPADVTSISLTAGDWDVWGIVTFNPNAATAITGMRAWINTTSATAPTLPAGGAYVIINGAFSAGQSIPAGQMRISVNATTTVYLATRSDFNTNTNAAYGFIGARRVR